MITIKARAKINLTLDVLGKRPDGYHNVEMIMQTIDLHDSISVQPCDTGIVITSNSGEIPLNEDNLVYRAAAALMKRTGHNEGAHINIDKRIPVAAGLAGGSSDAAAVLQALNQLWHLNLGEEELMATGATIGSDIPFCIKGGTALATGRGEIITDLPPLGKYWLVLAKPQIGVSTAEVYRNFKPEKVAGRPDTKAMIKAISVSDYREIKANLVNVLESVTLAAYPAVAEIKRDMAGAGLKSALMSGSGPTVFGFADSEAQAMQVAAQLKNKILVVLVTHTV